MKLEKGRENEGTMKGGHEGMEGRDGTEKREWRL